MLTAYTVTRIKCSHCQEMGHWKSKCPNPIKEDDADGDLEVDTGGVTADGGDTWGAAPTTNLKDDW